MKISDEVYAKAWTDIDNTKIMRRAITPFKHILSPDQVIECMQTALLRCLQNHKEGRQKFTTSLYRFTKWECYNEVRALLRQRRLKTVSLDSVSSNAYAYDNRPSDILEYIELLDENNRRLIESYFLKNMTLQNIGDRNGYTRKTAHCHVHKALDCLRQLYLES